MHLRPPSIDRGIQSFIWAVVFFLILWLGMLAVGVSQATSIIIAGVASFLIFILVRTKGTEPLDSA